MNSRALRPAAVPFLALALSALPARAVDPAFKLLRQDEKVNVYSRDGKDCEEGGADVLFVVENKTRERLELKMELLNLRIKNKLTVVVEPASNTSVLSLSPDAPLCGVELVDMKVNPLLAPGEKPAAPAAPAVPVTAATGAEPKI